MKEYIIDGITYRIGKNAAENTQLIKDSDKDWMWFHLEKFSSCHVVICHTEITNEHIIQAATLVKENSKYKFENIGINYCKISNLIHGVAVGSVHFISNKQVQLIRI